MATDYLLQEDGTSHLLLEDGSGAVILESSTGVSAIVFRRTLSSLGTRAGTRQVQEQS